MKENAAKNRCAEGIERAEHPGTLGCGMSLCDGLERIAEAGAYQSQYQYGNPFRLRCRQGWRFHDRYCAEGEKANEADFKNSDYKRVRLP